MPPELRIAKGKKQSVAHAHAPRQEKEKVKRLGGRLVPRSGAGQEKGDWRNKRVARLECKCTQNESFAITQEMIRKIENAALSSGEVPVIEVQFIDRLTKKTKHTVVVMPSYALDILKDGTASK